MSAEATGVFDYPDDYLVRRHGPQGYLDYKHYKPWLRDEFSFRCVYCLCRETWFPDGHAYFGTDHVLAQSQAPERLSTYDELVYACSMCNAWKKDFPVAMDFSALACAAHLEGQPDGTLRGLTRLGEGLIDVCALNRQEFLDAGQDGRVLGRQVVFLADVHDRMKDPHKSCSVCHSTSIFRGIRSSNPGP